MRKISFLFSLLLICLVSCNSEDVLFKTNSGTDNLSEEGIKLYAQKEIGISTKGVGLTHKFWEPGQTIRIKFLNGTETQKSKVMQFSQEWTEYANLNFEFVDTSEDADVKIAFDWQGDRVTWSAIGTDARDIPQHLPSLNFGNLSTFDAFIKRDVLMQFGHVLGLVNEHQGVNNTLELNTELIYDYYIAEGWTILEVQNFFFNPYASEITNYTEYDLQSIMVWPIDAIFTTNGIGQQRNSVLSEMDKEFITQIYPYADDDFRFTILRFSSEEEFTIDLKTSLNTSEFVSIDFGDGTQFEGVGTDIPEHSYQAGEYVVKIEADRMHLAFSVFSGGLLPGGKALKYVRLNGLTEYVDIYLAGTGLEEIQTDPENAPLLLETVLNKNFAATAIKTVPENLLYNCSGITKIFALFTNCLKLETVPANLFVNLTNVTHLQDIFSSCHSLLYLPENLFQNCTELTSLRQAFRDCVSLSEIPEKIFYNNTKLRNVELSFHYCISLENIPENLFENCTEINNFTSCFSDCRNVTGNAPKLWERPNVKSEHCFMRCINLSNYEEIPSNWK